MNSTKLFNFNYLKENIKKSLGLISLVSIVVPLFTILIIVLVVRGKIECVLADFSDIATVNVLGMYFVPVFISFALFGYVFNKKSVDFINSMPLSRKTIFVTNMIGGIAIITIIQLVTAIGLLVCNALCENVYIFSGMIWDAFILLWTGYVFVFAATNLAMSISGTFWTQVAVTLLILFLVPFYIMTSRGFSFYTNYSIMDNGEEIASENYFWLDDFEYIKSVTLPTSLICGSLAHNSSVYSTISITKTFVLSIIYLGIGLYLFDKRKMENAEESFSDTRVHLMIKALTMFPMIVFVRLLSGAGISSIIIYALIIMYYFVYDFIVKKKVSLKISISALIAILLVLNGFCSVSDEIFERTGRKNISLEKNNIKAVSVGTSYVGRDFDYFMENQELIDLLLNGAYEFETYGYDTVNVKRYYIFARFKDDKHTSCKFSIVLSKEEYDKLFEILEKDSDYVNYLKKTYTASGVITTSENYVIKDGELVKALNNEMIHAINQMSLEKLLGFSEDLSYSITKNYYENHQLKSREYSIEITDRTLELIAEYENKKMIKTLNEMEKLNPEYRNDFEF